VETHLKNRHEIPPSPSSSRPVMTHRGRGGETMRRRKTKRRRMLWYWYLAGPICHVKDGSDREWRDAAKTHLACIDPFDEEEHLWMEHRLPGEQPKDVMNRLRVEGQIDTVRKLMQEVLQLDKDCVQRADGVLAYSPFPSWGTIREITLAHEYGKPVVLWTPRRGEELSNTEIALSTKLVHSFDDAIEACIEFERV